MIYISSQECKQISCYIKNLDRLHKEKKENVHSSKTLSTRGKNLQEDQGVSRLSINIYVRAIQLSNSHRSLTLLDT